LCLALGRLPSELEKSIDAKTFSEFYDFYQLEPWGFELHDELTARITHNIGLFSGRLNESARLDDFRHPSRQHDND
jgi:hypothetical protein